ncbi:MAG: DUF1292 domain-containing protein [Bacilli bacterium]|nr:DUF1292 domain-containing protein [Bacilli bacterium]
MDFDLENDKITIEKEGKEVDCDILFTFDCEDTKKSYVGYSDNTIAANGRKTIYVSSYNPQNEEIILEDINDPKELDMIQEVLTKIDSEAADE